MECQPSTLALSVLALSSRFDGQPAAAAACPCQTLSVLALSSRFDGLFRVPYLCLLMLSFSTRSVESF